MKKLRSSAPKARNVKAWAIGPGGINEKLLSAESAKYPGVNAIIIFFSSTRPIPRLQRFQN